MVKTRNEAVIERFYILGSQLVEHYRILGRKIVKASLFRDKIIQVTTIAAALIKVQHGSFFCLQGGRDIEPVVIASIVCRIESAYAALDYGANGAVIYGNRVTGVCLGIYKAQGAFKVDGGAAVGFISSSKMNAVGNSWLFGDGLRLGADSRIAEKLLHTAGLGELI